MNHLFCFVTLIVFSSCSIFKHKKENCGETVKEAITSLSKYITRNNQTNIFTLHHEKLPKISETEYEKLRDSLEDVNFLPEPYNYVRHYLYCKKLEQLIDLKCKITISDIQNYYGLESYTGTKNDIIHSLYYYFNNTSDKDCYDPKGNNGKELGCSLLTFKFNNEGILIKSKGYGLAY